jgi:uncharacterized protein YyaL (SSP411 family)
LAIDLESLTDGVLHAIRKGEAASAPALSFLLQRYLATERPDVRDALEPALAAALDQPFDAMPAADRAPYVTAFVEAAALAEDDRPRAMVSSLVSSLRAAWTMTTRVDESAAILEACLTAAAVLDPRTIVPDAVDELERVIGAVYQPGRGLASDVGAPDVSRGGLNDHVQAASALLTAYNTTARIPYAMLAEELMQFVRRSLWDDEEGVFAAAAGSHAHPFLGNCAAARVWCRLAALHAEDDYRAAAVTAPDAAYRAEAARVLVARPVVLAASGMAGAVYGLALLEWLAL